MNNFIFLFAGLCFPGQTGCAEPGAEGWVLWDPGLCLGEFFPGTGGFLGTNCSLDVLPWNSFLFTVSVVLREIKSAGIVL